MLTKLIAWLLWRQVKTELSNLKNIQAHMDLAWNILCREVKSTPSIVAKAVLYQQDVQQTMADRLTKRFDPAMALNEAYNAALDRKDKIINDPDPVKPLTGKQQAALAWQQETLRRRLQGGK